MIVYLSKLIWESLELTEYNYAFWTTIEHKGQDWAPVKSTYASDYQWPFQDGRYLRIKIWFFDVHRVFDVHEASGRS